MTDDQAAYWKRWGPLLAVGIVLVSLAVAQGGAGWLTAGAAVAGETAVAMRFAWIVRDPEQAERVRRLLRTLRE